VGIIEGKIAAWKGPPPRIDDLVSAVYEDTMGKHFTRKDIRRAVYWLTDRQKI